MSKDKLTVDKLIVSVNCSFIVLGLAICVIGVATTLGCIVGFIEVKGESSIELIGIKVNTINAFFLMVLGIAITFIGEYMTGKIGEVGKARRGEKSTLTTSNREEGGYSISEKEVTVDLRNRKSVDNLLGHLSSQLSSTERTVKISFSNPDSLPDEINIRHATSGPSIDRISVPKNSEWRIIKEESKEILENPFYRLLEMRKQKFRDLITRRGKMKSYYLIVRKEDLQGYELEYKLKYYNSFVGDDFEWFGEDASADIDVLTMSVYFPSDKKVKSCKVFVLMPGKDKPDLISDPHVEISDDNLFLKWTLEGAKKGYKYLLKWYW